MKQLILIAVIPLLLMHCIGQPILFSPNSANHTTEINTTTGQELLDLQQALDSGIITQEEYDELRKKIIMEKLDTPVDSTDTDSLSRTMEILINTIQTYG